METFVFLLVQNKMRGGVTTRQIYFSLGLNHTFSTNLKIFIRINFIEILEMFHGNESL